MDFKATLKLKVIVIVYVNLKQGDIQYKMDQIQSINLICLIML